VQLFTKNNNQWRAKPLTDARIAAFRAALDETGIAEAVAHNSYLINLASPDDALWAKSIGALADELERAEALGIGLLVCHPGAHVGAGEEAGLDRIVRGLDEVHRRTRGVAARILLETTAGQGTCLGHRFEHLGAILGRVAEPERLGVCADTCHIFAAGYSLASGIRTIRPSRRWGRPSGWSGSGSGTSTTAGATAAAGSIATPASAGAAWAGAVPPAGQRPPVRLGPDDLGDAQGDGRGGGSRRRQPARPPGSCGRGGPAGPDPPAAQDRASEGRSHAGRHHHQWGRDDAGRLLRPAGGGEPRPEPLHQPRARLAGVQRARAGGGPRPSNPLLDRLRFLAISASNLDEFFEVRVAGLQAQLYDNLEPQDPPPDGMGPLAQLVEIARRTHDFVGRQYDVWRSEIRPQLAERGIVVCGCDDLTPRRTSSSTATSRPRSTRS
jgi:hypothetical protein